MAEQPTKQQQKPQPPLRTFRVIIADGDDEEKRVKVTTYSAAGNYWAPICGAFVSDLCFDKTARETDFLENTEKLATRVVEIINALNEQLKVVNEKHTSTRYVLEKAIIGTTWSAQGLHDDLNDQREHGLYSRCVCLCNHTVTVHCDSGATTSTRSFNPWPS